MTARFSLIFSILILVSPCIQWGCSSRKGPEFPAVENLDLKYKFDKNSTRRYRVKCIYDSPAAGNMTSSRNLSLTWTHKVKEVNEDGSARIENRIEDVVFETEGASPPPGNISSAIRNTLAGAVYSFDVTARGGVSNWSGNDIDWPKSFQNYFKKESTPEPLQEFIIKMAELYFSHDQLSTMLTLPYRMLPQKPLNSASKWEELRNVAVFGINADTSTWFLVKGYTKFKEKTALVLVLKSNWMSGSSEVNIPNPNMPIVMEVNIEQGKMKGKLYIDPTSGKVLGSDEVYEISLEARTGLPSLEPGEKVSKDAPGVTMKIEYKVRLEEL